MAKGIKTGGRQAGTRNKITQGAKANIMRVFEEIGGVENFANAVKRIAGLEGSFRVAELWIQILRNDLAGMGYDLDGNPMAAKKTGGKA